MRTPSQKRIDPKQSNILDKDITQLAQRIRTERLKRGWSLDEMARHSGVSRAMINRIENGSSSPTATVLGKISGAYQLSMSELLSAPSEPKETRLVRAQDRRSWRDPETGYLREQISYVPHSDAEPSPVPQITRVTLPEGANVSFPKDAFQFLSQAIWILEGTLHFTEGGITHVLKPDDCLTLGAPAPCTFANQSAAPCTYIVVLETKGR